MKKNEDFYAFRNRLGIGTDWATVLEYNKSTVSLLFFLNNCDQCNWQFIADMMIIIILNSFQNWNDGKKFFPENFQINYGFQNLLQNLFLNLFRNLAKINSSRFFFQKSFIFAFVDTRCPAHTVNTRSVRKNSFLESF